MEVHENEVRNQHNNRDNTFTRPDHSVDVPDHIDVAIASSDVILRYIDDLNARMTALSPKIESYQNRVVDLSYAYDVAKITLDKIVGEKGSAEILEDLRRDVAEKKRNLEYAKVDLKCAMRSSTTITGFRMSAMAALKAHRP